MSTRKNKDPFAPCNHPMSKDDPFAPHNSIMDRDNPFKPWNQPFWNEDDLTEDEKDYYEQYE